MGHDTAHPGYSNRYLVQSCDKIALTYNDMSVLENMHCANLFKLLAHRESDILLSLSRDFRCYFRKHTIELILSTDFNKHFSLYNKFHSRVFNLSDLDLNSEEDKFLILQVFLKCSDLSYTAKPIE